MRYLSSISLALIVLMALACTATPATLAPTPPGPMLAEAEAIAVVKDYLGLKNIGKMNCLAYTSVRDPRWSARYDGDGVWKVKVDTVDESVAYRVGQGGTYTAEQLRQRSKHPGKWDLYEKTQSVVVTSDNNC
jgi:hypothetical protein